MTDFAPVRYGVLGAANIARQFTRGLAGSAIARVDAVASRGADKSAAFAAELNIPRSLGSYEALLADPAIDAIYIPLPNTLHAEWAIKCAEAGKHVLCEKPLATSTADARKMFAAARAHGVHLAEAYPYMAQPQTLRLRELLAEGVVGRPQMLVSAFGFSLCTPEGEPLRDPGNIRLNPSEGGGALLDAGTYSMSFARIAAGAAPKRARASSTWTTTGVDLTVVAAVEFVTGLVAQVSCSMASAYHRHGYIVGDQGTIETDYANHGPVGGGTLSLQVRRGIPNGTPLDVLNVPAGDGFLLEGESFARMVRLGAEHWNGATEAESIDTARALEAIAASIRADGKWVDVAA